MQTPRLLDVDAEAEPGRPDDIAPLRYLPSLDGIRGLAVLAVFFFHVGYPWASGGFLGVSVFFTLSGYLITRLLLDEIARDRTIDLLRFWGRRLRRLLPAALLTILFILVLSATVFDFDPDKLRRDMLATIGYSANWHFLYSSQSYADLFSSPSPLLHYWSLAIEEQFYLFYPLIVLGVVKVAQTARRSRKVLRSVLIVLFAASVLSTVIARGDGDFVYYSLPTRAAELIAGALLACSVRVTRTEGRASGPWSLVLGVATLAMIGWICTATTRSSGWVTGGGLPLFSLLSVALLVAALPAGPFARVLGAAPLRSLGLVSYGVYLFHWPIVLWLTPARVGVDGDALVLIQAVVTLVISVASYVFVERPIRRRKVLVGRSGSVGAPVAIAAMVGAVFVVTNALPQTVTTDLDAAARRLERTTAANSANADATVPRLAVFGDSTALLTAVLMNDWSAQTELAAPVPGSAGFGCGLVRDGDVRYLGRIVSLTTELPMHCGTDLVTEWNRMLDADLPDVAVVQIGPIDVADHQFPGDPTWRGPGDPVYDARLRAELTTAADLLLARGIPVVWLTSPVIDGGSHMTPPTTDLPEDDPARMARFNEIVRDVARTRPGMHVVDLAAWVQRWPNGPFDPALRSDGIHFSQTNTEVAKWLGPKILAFVPDRAP